MYNPKAKKHLWQNFLKNKSILARIVGEGNLEDKHILEIGPGPGDLTEALLTKKPLTLDLVELDADMFPLLQERFNGENITIYHHDILKIDIQKGLRKKESWILFAQWNIIYYPSYEVYGNIPYYITSPILRHLLYEVSLSPDAITVTMQKEVADRILARDGKHSVLSLSCWLVSDVEKICDISPNNFVPVPKVWSTCLKFKTKQSDKQEAKKILSLIEKWFSQKRKKLISNLSEKFEKTKIMKLFQELWISENVRAEDLDLDKWKLLSNKLT